MTSWLQSQPVAAFRVSRRASVLCTDLPFGFVGSLCVMSKCLYPLYSVNGTFSTPVHQCFRPCCGLMRKYLIETLITSDAFRELPRVVPGLCTPYSYQPADLPTYRSELRRACSGKLLSLSKMASGSNAAILSPLQRADGSASYSANGFSVICAINGPVEVQRRDELPEEAAVDVVVRPLSAVGGRRLSCYYHAHFH